MAFQPITGSASSPGSGVFPILVFVQGNEQRMMNLDHTPFTVGRKVDKDLVADPRVSRDHALITSEDGQFCVVDQGSKHGTFVNGERVQRRCWSGTIAWSSASAMWPTSCSIPFMQAPTLRGNF